MTVGKLFGALGEQLAKFVQVVAAFSAPFLGHPRSVAVMGWSDIPLRQAADADFLPWGQGLRRSPHSATCPAAICCLRVEAESRPAWRALPFQLSVAVR